MKIFAENFDKIYLEYFARLFRFAREYLFSDEEAKNLVQDIFLSIWEKREILDVQGNISTYLLVLTKNKCIDYLRHKKVRIRYKEEIARNIASLKELNKAFENEQEIESIIQRAVNTLPPKCKEIFLLSRLNGKKYHEIASILDISINTVESQMSIALKKMREELKFLAEN